ncbi:tripartite tricarboxylate transporter substrate binding protein [Roseomonas sp. HJA6]|uniref:Tripartite tricarboxylate transporter substrate binding protein n=1 Tax=Roseomonas alba TaxID=2846776 RepID=A0ABS7A628_9PROT|nr:tripartite tricarboxylate transporter substrate binding protein [Neoroseomonas alba]MBW6397716.1 tripartite tricarboxylate transporter substrate binding protein [Neoroseomonas alba]
MTILTQRRALILGVLASPTIARATQPFPARPVRLVSPFPPGATNDNSARAIARSLSARFGVPVVVDNRAGAGGAVGARQVADSHGDGYTLLNASAGNLTIAPHLSAVGYDPLRAFAPVALTGDAYAIVAVNPDLPVRSVADLVAYARRNPGRLNYASAGIGSAGHLRGALLAEDGGYDAVHVPYPGSAPAVNSVISGDCHLMIDPITSVHVASGRLRGLATVAAGRWEDFPDLPTITEAGFGAAWPSGGWFGAFAPAGTPPEVVARLNEAWNAALAEPETASALRRMGLRPEPVAPEDLARRVVRDYAATGEALRRLSIT